MDPLHEFGNPLFDDGGDAAVEEIDLCLGHIDANDRVAAVSEACRGDTTDVAETEHRDPS